jgi:O-antigen/teichoic acid export membrane protein
VRAQYPSLVEIAVRLPLILWSAIYSPTVWGITFAYVAGASASALYCFPALLSRLDRFKRSEARLMLHFAWPLVGSMGLTYLATNLMPFIVNAVSGVRDLNIFNAVNGFRAVALSLATAVTVPLFPLISRLHQQSDHVAIKNRTVQALRFTSILVFPGSLILAFFSHDLLEVLTTPVYFSGSVAMTILALSVIPACLSTIIFTSMIAIGRQRLELYVAGCQTLVLVGVSLALLGAGGALPSLGIITIAAIAVLLSSGVAFIMNLYFLNYLITRHWPGRSLAVILGCSFIGIGAVWFADSLANLEPRLNLVVAIFGGSATVFMLLALVGELTGDDVQLVTSSLGLPRTFGNLLSALCWRKHHVALENGSEA